MSKNTNTAESEILKAMENALKFRNARDKIKQSIEDADTSISKLKSLIAEKQAQKKKAKKNLKKYQNEEKLISAIAGIPSPETERKNRPYYATKGFFDLLNTFDLKGEKKFFEMYNSLKDTKALVRIVLESTYHCFYDKEKPNPDRDYVFIDGVTLRKKINEELKKQEINIEAARIKLDKTYNERINKVDSKNNEETSDSSSVVDNESEYE